MLNILLKQPIVVNKNINDYCKTTTNEFIQKVIKKHTLDKNKITFNLSNVSDNDDDNNNKKVLLYGSLFISVSIISFFLQKYFLRNK